jgi:hypothetical protein
MVFFFRLFLFVFFQPSWGTESFLDCNKRRSNKASGGVIVVERKTRAVTVAGVNGAGCGSKIVLTGCRLLLLKI